MNKRHANPVVLRQTGALDSNALQSVGVSEVKAVDQIVLGIIKPDEVPPAALRSHFLRKLPALCVELVFTSPPSRTTSLGAKYDRSNLCHCSRGAFQHGKVADE